jgi:hypothetical protein
MDIQTETCAALTCAVQRVANLVTRCRYLEEISDRPMEESLATQTDQMMDRFGCCARCAAASQ